MVAMEKTCFSFSKRIFVATTRERLVELCSHRPSARTVRVFVKATQPWTLSAACAGRGMEAEVRGSRSPRSGTKANSCENRDSKTLFLLEPQIP